jgi:MFS superfamily sulfate permease-like transporter
MITHNDTYIDESNCVLLVVIVMIVVIAMVVVMVVVGVVVVIIIVIFRALRALLALPKCIYSVCAARNKPLHTSFSHLRKIGPSKPFLSRVTCRVTSDSNWNHPQSSTIIHPTTEVDYSDLSDLYRFECPAH